MLRGKVPIPAAIQGGFLRPILDWLEDARNEEATEGRQQHRLFDNVDSRTLHSDNACEVGEMGNSFSEAGHMIIKRISKVKVLY